MNSKTNKLGTGFRFPPVGALGWGWIAGADAVDQAVRAVLLTEPGERIGRPTFGVGLRRFLFQPNSLETRAQIRKAITDALPRDEPRIRLEDVAVTADARESTMVRIAIRYQVPPDPGPRSLVYPFHLDTGA